MVVRYEENGPIALITIDRPEARNAMDVESYLQLVRCWRRVRDTSEIRVAVITGVGDSFCAGADLKKLIPQVTDRSGGPRDDWPTEDLQHACLRNFDIFKPIVAAVNGFCVAAGTEMLLGMDIRVASETASFGLPEVRHGLFCSGGSTVRLPRQLSFPHAMDILLTGRRFGAHEALAMGLINKVVAPDALMPAAMEYAELIAANSPGAVQATKESVMRGLGLDRQSAYDLESEIGATVFAHPDAKEGATAFVEKRRPTWSS
jgi:enoyl-CoA hydratase